MHLRVFVCQWMKRKNKKLWPDWVSPNLEGGMRLKVSLDVGADRCIRFGGV